MLKDVLTVNEEIRRHFPELPLILFGHSMGSLAVRAFAAKHDDCMNMLYSLDSDDCSSLGIMMVDVPEYESLKEQRGFEYGRQLLLGISEVLFEVFGNAPIFHTREEEFVVLCTDVAYHSFLNLCARAKQMMGRSRKGLFRMGATWSDKVYNARDLVSKARSIMECDTSRERIESRFQTVQKQDRTVQQNVLDKLQTQGEMTIYLQPKIDMKNGCLMGTEALVRFVDQEGKLLPHGRVIEEMNGKEPYSSWIILCLTGCWRP